MLAVAESFEEFRLGGFESGGKVRVVGKEGFPGEGFCGFWIRVSYCG